MLRRYFLCADSLPIASDGISYAALQAHLVVIDVWKTCHTARASTVRTNVFKPELEKC